MENLKEKLNSIPQDFDREKLWNKIQAKKKKKRFFWFWLFPLLIAFYFLMTTFDTSLNVESDRPISSATQVNTLKPIPKEDIEYVNEETHVLNKSAAFQTTTNQQINNALTELEKNKTFQNQKIIPLEDDDLSTKKNLNQIDRTLLSTFSEEGVNFNAKASQESNDNNEDLKSVTINSVLNNEISRGLIDISAIEQLSFWQIINSNQKLDQLGNRDLEPYLKERAKHDLPFYTSLAIGGGSDFHDFIDANRSNEKELESLNASIEIEQFLTKRFSVSGGLSYTRNSTNLKHEEEHSNIGLVNGSLVNDKYITSYNLYNNYTRFDAYLGLKYSLEVKQFILSPTVGFGYNISSKVDGEFFEDGSQLSPLSTLGYKESSGIFGEFSMEIGYELDNNMIIGISGNLQTSRILDLEEKHTIRPFLFSVFMKKSIW